MIAATLLALTLTPISTTTADIHVEALVETWLAADERTFRVENLGTYPELLLFGSEETGVVAHVHLAAGGIAEFPFSRSIVDQVAVEVLVLEPGRVRSIGAWALADLRQSPEGRLVIHEGVAGYPAGRGHASAYPQPSFLAASWRPSVFPIASSSAAAGSPATTHVPEGPLVPAQQPKRPTVRKDPLPEF